MMSTVYAQLGAAAVILAILGLRAAFKNRFPAKVFVCLWVAVMVWTLLPFGISTDLSIYRFAPQSVSTAGKNLSTPESASALQPQSEQPQSEQPQSAAPAESNVSEIVIKPADENSSKTEISHSNAENDSVNTTERPRGNDGAQRNGALSIERIFSTVRICGAATMAAYIIAKYIFDINKYRRFASPCGGKAAEWLAKQPKSKKMRVYESAEVESPLTFGFFKPVILLPLGVTEEQLPNLLAHEYVHARDNDFLLRALCSLALAWNWFNPLVWIAAIFMNRDIERYCDERSLRLLGGGAAGYMNTLLDYAERQSGISALSYFSAGSFEERITSIIKGKNKRIGIVAAAVIAAIIITVAVIFGTAPKEQKPENEFTRGIKASETALWSFSDVFDEEYAEPMKDCGMLKWLPDSAIVISAEGGTPVYAMQDGKIAAAALTSDMGWVVAIEQEDGDTAVYGNLALPDKRIAAGNKIRKGGFIANTDDTHDELLLDILRGGNSVFCERRSFDWYFDEKAALELDTQALCENSEAPELAEIINTLVQSVSFNDFTDFDFDAGLTAAQSEYLNYAALIRAYCIEWFEPTNGLSEEKQNAIAARWGDNSEWTISLSMKAMSILYDELFMGEMGGTDVPPVHRYENGGNVLYVPEAERYVMAESQGMFGTGFYTQVVSVEKEEDNYTTYTVKFVLCYSYGVEINGQWKRYISVDGYNEAEGIVTKENKAKLLESDIYGARIVKLRDGSTYIDAMWKGEANPLAIEKPKVDQGSLSDEKLKAVAEDAVLNFGAERQENGTLLISDRSLFWSWGFNSAEDLSGYSFWIWRVEKAVRDGENISEKPDGGWYFPSTDYERVIQQYFDVSTEALRGDEDGVYHADEDAYWPEEGGGGRGAPVEVHIVGLVKEGELLHIKAELVDADTGFVDEQRTLTIRLEEDGGYKFVSYSEKKAVYTSQLQENKEAADAAIAAVRTYVHHDLPQNSITKIDVDIKQTNFFINCAFASEYGNLSEEMFKSRNYCLSNFLVVHAVRKMNFKNPAERGMYNNVHSTLPSGSDEQAFSYFVFRDEESGEWQVKGLAEYSYNAFENIDYDSLKRIFVDDDIVTDYETRPVQESEIDPESDFAKACMEEAKANIVNWMESFDEVKSCKIVSCEIDMKATNLNIKEYWSGGYRYYNYTLAKYFLCVETVLDVEMAEGHENSGFGRIYGPINVDIMPGETVVRMHKQDIMVYDPDNVIRYAEDTESGWKQVDGFGYM